jgi:hypothetical protein
MVTTASSTDTDTDIITKLANLSLPNIEYLPDKTNKKTKTPVLDFSNNAVYRSYAEELLNNELYFEYARSLLATNEEKNLISDIKTGRTFLVIL